MMRDPCDPFEAKSGLFPNEETHVDNPKKGSQRSRLGWGGRSNLHEKVLMKRPFGAFNTRGTRVKGKSANWGRK